MPNEGFHRHDHSTCVETALASAEARCAEERLRLTPVRRRILEILLEEHRALGAYDILDRLRAEGMAAQPPVAYRALEFLVGNGFAHRIARRSAYIACTEQDPDHAPMFLICRSCDSIAESSIKRTDLAREAKHAGFVIEHQVLEAEGLCPACTDTAAP